MSKPGPQKLLISLQGGATREYAEAASLVIGRSTETDFPIVDNAVSREHLRIQVAGSEIFLTDLSSMNGTLLNGKRMPGNVAIRYRQGDPLCVGATRIKVTIRFAPAEATATAVPAAGGGDDKTDAIDISSLSLRPPPATREVLRPLSQLAPQAEPRAEEETPSPYAVLRELEEPAESPAPRSSRGDEEETEGGSGSDGATDTGVHPVSSEAEARGRKRAVIAVLKARSKAAKIRNEARKLADAMLAEAKMTRRQAEEFSVDLLDRAEAAKREAGALESSRGALEEEIRKLGREHEKALSGLVEMRSNLEYLRTETAKAEAEHRDSVGREVEIRRVHAELEAEIARLRAECESAARKAAEAEGLRIAAAQRTDELGRQAESIREELDELRRIRASDRTLEEIERLKQERDGLQEEFERTRESLRKCREDTLLELRRVKAQQETEEAECRLRTVKAQVELEETISRKAVAERELQAAAAENETARREASALAERAERLRGEIAAGEARAEALRSEGSELAARNESSQQRALQQEARLAELEGKVRELEKARLKAEDEILSAKSAARAECEEARARSAAERARERERAEQEIEALKSQGAMQAVQAKRKGKDEADRIVREAREDAERMAAKAAEECEVVRSETLARLDAMREKSEAEAEARRAEADAYAARIRDAIDREWDERKRKLDLEFAQMRVLEMSEQSSLRARFESELQARRRTEVSGIAGNLERIIGARIAQLASHVPLADAEAHQRRVQELISEIEPVVREAMTPKDELEAPESLQKVIALDPVARSRARKFWTRAGILGGALLALWLVHLVFPSAYPSLGRKVAGFVLRDQNAADALVRQIMEERSRRPKYSPETSREYRESYVANVLHLERYAELKQDTELQKKWVLELNRFFLNELGLKEGAVVRFIAAEATLVRELARLRDLVNPQFEKEGVQRMTDAEKDSLPELREIVGSESSFKRLREFEKAFYLRTVDGS